MRKIILLVALSCGIPEMIAAQEASLLQRGARIEVTPLKAKRGAGRLISVGNDSLFYLRDPGAHSESVALSDITRIRVSRGRDHVVGALTKGLMGTGIGMLTGGLIAAATWKEGSVDFFCGGSRGACAAFGSTVGGTFGLVGGILYGAISGNERWENVPLPRR
jgi:hypothetical protein